MINGFSVCQKERVLQQLSELNKLYLSSAERNVLYEIRQILAKYLAQYLDDIDMRIKFILVEFCPPFENYDTIENHINNIFQYDYNNIKALLILAHAQYIYFVYSDLLLLQHEYADSIIMRGIQVPYDPAHAFVNTLYNWEKSLQKDR